MPPRSAPTAATMNSIAMTSMRVDPKDVTVPIQRAPFVETHVATTKIATDSTAMSQG